jgi:hypothetical protein
MYMPNFLDGFDRLVAFDALSTDLSAFIIIRSGLGFGLDGDPSY